MKKSVVIFAAVVLTLTGCGSGSNAFEKARMDDCLDLYYANAPEWEQDEVSNPVKSIKYIANGPDTGTVNGGVSDIEFASDEALFIFQCSVSGLDVKLDYARSVFDE